MRNRFPFPRPKVLVGDQLAAEIKQRLATPEMVRVVDQADGTIAVEVPEDVTDTSVIKEAIAAHTGQITPDEGQVLRGELKALGSRLSTTSGTERDTIVREAVQKLIRLATREGA